VSIECVIGVFSESARNPHTHAPKNERVIDRAWAEGAMGTTHPLVPLEMSGAFSSTALRLFFAPCPCTISTNRELSPSLAHKFRGRTQSLSLLASLWPLLALTSITLVARALACKKRVCRKCWKQREKTKQGVPWKTRAMIA
jgi:hypothetical protein